MATSPYPEYESVGIIDGFKALSALQDELAQIEIDIKNGYTRNLKSDNINVRGKKQDLPQFSDLRNTFLERQKEITARQSVLSTILERKAKDYVPLTGPELPIAKEEKRIVSIILGKPVAATNDSAATQNTVVPAKALIGPKGFVGPQLSDMSTPASSSSNNGGLKATSSTIVSKQSAADQKTYVNAQLVAQKLTDTPANRKLLREQYKKTKAPVSDTAWLDEFAQTYTAYADWTTQNVVDHFGSDFVQVLKDAVANNYTVDEIQAKIKGTSYYGNVSQKQYEFDGSGAPKQKELIESTRRSIASDYADAGLSESDLTELARTSARSGLTGVGLKQAVYQYSLRKTSMATDFANPVTAKNALQGADADAIRQSAKAYGYLVSDAELQAALTGGMYNGVTVSKDSIVQKAQRVAKGQYQQLSDQIDSGASLDDIFANYKNYAARTLEIDPGTIDFINDPKWQAAFGTKETGQMSLSDWVTKLKSDKRFGYQNTQQANQDATSIGLAIAKAFGKVK
jgi:hypothetical protein